MAQIAWEKRTVMIRMSGLRKARDGSGRGGRRVLDVAPAEACIVAGQRCSYMWQRTFLRKLLR